MTELGVMTPEQVKSFATKAGMGGSDGDAKAFARMLVQEGKLTQFQANAIYQGHAGALLIGEYLVQEKIGQGGMGAVYKAEHRMMKRVAAVKLMSAALASTEVARQRFLREVQAAARLVHPNIVTAYDAGLHHGTPYLAMEFVAGVDLKTLIHKKGAVPWERAMDLIKQAAKGLLYAHESGVIHRDVKPANILLSREGTVKILDMGLARLSAAEGRTELEITQSGSLMGTAAFMAPEQARDAKRADHRSDIYALGCTMYYLMAGKLPYEGESAVDMMLVKMEKPPPRIDESVMNAPPSLQDVFEGMVAVNPEDRYQSLKDVLSDLESIRQGDATVVRAPSNKSLLATEIDQMRRPAGGEPAQTIDTNVTGGVGELVRLERRRTAVPLNKVAKVGIIAGVAAMVLIAGLVVGLSGKRKARRLAAREEANATAAATPEVKPAKAPLATPVAAVAPTAMVPASTTPTADAMLPASTAVPRATVKPAMSISADRPQRLFSVMPHESVILEESFEDNESVHLWRPTSSSITAMTVHDGLAVPPADASSGSALLMRQTSGLDITHGPVHVYWRVYTPYVEGKTATTVEVAAGGWVVQFQPHTQLKYIVGGNRSNAYVVPVDAVSSSPAKNHLGDRSRSWFDFRLDVRMLPGGVGDYSVYVYVDALSQWEPVATASNSGMAPAPGEAFRPPVTQVQMLTLRVDAGESVSPAGIEAVKVTQDPPPMRERTQASNEGTSEQASGSQQPQRPGTGGGSGLPPRLPPGGRRPLPPRPGQR